MRFLECGPAWPPVMALSRRALQPRQRPVRPTGLRLPCQRLNPSLMRTDIEHLGGDLWVFGYGSLIWRPGFDYLERAPARLIGAHRALCVFSHVHRGTPERPGLVLGLDFGGACRGVAYRVAAKKRADTIAYLRDRVQSTAVYR